MKIETGNKENRNKQDHQGDLGKSEMQILHECPPFRLAETPQLHGESNFGSMTDGAVEKGQKCRRQHFDLILYAVGGNAPHRLTLNDGIVFLFEQREKPLSHTDEHGVTIGDLPGDQHQHRVIRRCPGEHLDRREGHRHGAEGSEKSHGDRPAVNGKDPPMSDDSTFSVEEQLHQKDLRRHDEK